MCVCNVCNVCMCVCVCVCVLCACMCHRGTSINTISDKKLLPLNNDDMSLSFIQ